MKSILQKQRNFEKEIINFNIKAKFDNKNVTSVANIIDYLTDCNILSFSMFSYTTDLKEDQGYRKIKGTDKLPSEKVCHDLLKDLPEETLNKHSAINKQILEIKSLTEDIREICINIYDSSNHLQ